MEPTLNNEASTIKSRDRHLSVTVETAKLWEKPYPGTSEKDIDDCVAIYDDDGLGSGYRSPKKEYETEVYKGKKVRWTTATQNAVRVAVRLMSISHNPTRGNPQYFDHSPLLPDRYDTVEGTIMDIENLADDNYTINIELIQMDTKELRLYAIDPKLRIKPSN